MLGFVYGLGSYTSAAAVAQEVCVCVCGVQFRKQTHTLENVTKSGKTDAKRSVVSRGSSSFDGRKQSTAESKAKAQAHVRHHRSSLAQNTHDKLDACEIEHGHITPSGLSHGTFSLPLELACRCGEAAADFIAVVLCCVCVCQCERSCRHFYS